MLSLSLPCQVFSSAKFFFPCNQIKPSLFLSSPLFNAFSARYGSPKRQLQFYRYLPLSCSLSPSSLSFSLSLCQVLVLYLPKQISFCRSDQSFCAVFFAFVQISPTFLWLNTLEALMSVLHIATCWPHTHTGLTTRCHYQHLSVITLLQPAGDCYCSLQWQSRALKRYQRCKESSR